MKKSLSVGVPITFLFMVMGCERANHAPEITGFTASAESVLPGDTVKLSVTAEDEDGDSLIYNWQASGGEISVLSTPDSARWVAPNQGGSYSIVVEVDDQKGGKDAALKAISVEGSAVALCVLYADNWWDGWEYGGGAILFSDPLPDPQTARAVFKGDGYTETIQEFEGYPGYIYGYNDEMTLLYNLRYDVEFLVASDTAKGTAWLPGPFMITSPEDEDILPKGSVTIAWSEAAHADWYWVWIFAEAYDSNGYWITDKDTSFAVTTTGATIPASFFYVEGLQYWEVYCFVSAMGGPSLEPGSQGNMSGAFTGFFVGEMDPSEGAVFFYLGTPVTIVAAAHRPGPDLTEHRERLKTYLLDRIGIER